MSDHTPSLATARAVFIDGAEGEFVGEDFDCMIEDVRAEEREKAAQIAEENLGRVWVVSETPRDIATRIREQGKEQGS